MNTNTYKIDFTTNTMTITRSFERAANRPGSEEYEFIKKVIADFPTMVIVRKAKEIIIAFDRQYREAGGDSLEWSFYEQKSKELARKAGKYVTISRIIDTGNLLDYKDAPIDKGKDVFEMLYSKREVLTM